MEDDISRHFDILLEGYKTQPQIWRERIAELEREIDTAREILEEVAHQDFLVADGRMYCSYRAACAPSSSDEGTHHFKHVADCPVTKAREWMEKHP